MNFQETFKSQWLCSLCLLSDLPFYSVDNNELISFFSLNDYLQQKLVFEDKLFDPIKFFHESEIDLSPFNFNNCKYYLHNEFNDYVAATDIGFACFHLNCRSFRDKCFSIDCFLHTLDINFDFVTFSETWLRADEVNMYSSLFKNYSFFHTCRNNRLGGGVAAYINNNFEVQLLDICQYNNFEHLTLLIKSHPDTAKRRIILSIIYRPPNLSLLEFLESFSNYMEKLNEYSSTISNKLFVGDFNIDLLQCEDLNTNRFLDTLMTASLVPTIIHPTRITNHSATLIDNIFSNIPHIGSGIFYSDISDHLPIFTIFKWSKKEIVLCPKNSVHVDFKHLISDLITTRWPNYLKDFTNIDDAYNNFSNFLQSKIEIYTLPNRMKNYVKQEWMTPALLSSCKEKNRLYKKFLRGKITKLEYNSYKSQLQRLIKIRKKEYHCDFITKHQKNTKLIWQHINEFLGNKKKLITQSLAIDVNAMNKFFAELGRETTKNIPFTDQYRSYLQNPSNGSFFLHPVCEREIINVTNSLATKHSVGIDNMSTSTLKRLIGVIAPQLTDLINFSFVTGTFPNSLKIAKIIPIYKTGPKDALINYRPISILPAISKVFEKTVVSRLKNFFKNQNSLLSSQHGFREGYSTQTALFCATEFINTSCDNKLYTLGIFLDVSKAFDSVCYKILLDKLQYLGIRGIPLEWFKSYLSNRFQFIKYNELISDFWPISCGVPQGSLLGPILYIIYANDLPTASDLFKFVQYADDTSLFVADRDLKHLFDIANAEFKKVAQWFYDNKLLLNAIKSCVIIFEPVYSGTNNNNTYNIIHNNVALKRVTETKFLGVYIDCKMSWKYHLSHLAKKLSCDLAMMNFTSRCLPNDCLFLLYNAVFMSHLTYGIDFWSMARKTFINQILILQKKAVRIIMKNRQRHIYTHVSDFCLENNMLLLNDYIFYNKCLFMYKVYYAHWPLCIIELFARLSDSVHHATRNHNLNFCVYRCNYKCTQTSIRHCGVNIWNNLPITIKSLLSIVSFKRAIKLLIQQKSFSQFIYA